MSSVATEFAVPCDACRQELGVGRGVWLRDATVSGTLRVEADVGFASCLRGHRVVVRRAVSRQLAVAS